jgi:hypothetical protein
MDKEQILSKYVVKLYDQFNQQFEAIIYPDAQKAMKEWAASSPSPSLREAKEFDKCVGEQRDAFVRIIREQKWDNQLRTAAESLLIIYDQMRERLAARTALASEGDGWVKLSEKLPDIDRLITVWWPSKQTIESYKFNEWSRNYYSTEEGRARIGDRIWTYVIPTPPTVNQST